MASEDSEKKRSEEKGSDQHWLEQLRVDQAELVLFTRQLTVLVESGIEIRTALMALVRGTKKEDFSALVTRVLHCIEAGWSLSDSFAQFPKVFSKVYVSMVKIGEESGSLGPCLEALASWLESEEQLLRDLKGSLYYPVTVLVVAFVLTIAFLTVIFPSFAESMVAGESVPLPTQVLMFASSLLLNPLAWLVLCAGSALMFHSSRVFFSTEKNRARIYKAVLRVPYLGELLRSINCSRFCSAFGILQRNGVDFVKSFRLSCQASGSPLASEYMIEGTTMIIAGGRLTHYLKQRPETFLPVVVDLLAVAEETARIPDICCRLQELLEGNVRYSLEVVQGLLEPLLMVFISTIVATLIVCTAMPMYSQFLDNL